MLQLLPGIYIKDRAKVLIEGKLKTNKIPHSDSTGSSPL